MARRLRRWAGAWVAAVACVLTAACGQPASAPGVAPKPALVFFGDRDHAPYETLDGGQPRGASVDLIEALGRQMGRRVEIRLLDWSEAQARLLAGEGDALTLMARSPERELRFAFSRATLPMSLSLIVRSRDAPQFSVDKLAGRRVGVTAAGAPRLVLSRTRPEATLVVVDTIQDGLQALLREEIDALAGVTWVQLHQINRLGLTGLVPLPPFHYLQPSIAVRRSDAALLAEIDAALVALERSGAIARIIDRWSDQHIYTFTGYTVRMGEIAGMVAGLALLALGLAVMLLLRQRRELARQVAVRGQAEAAAEQRASEARTLQRMATALAGAMTPDEVGLILRRLVADLPSPPTVWLAKPWRNRPGWRTLASGPPGGITDPADLLAALERAAQDQVEPAFRDRAGLAALWPADPTGADPLAGVDGAWFYFSLLLPALPRPDAQPLGAILLAWRERPASFAVEGGGPARASLDGVAALVGQALEQIGRAHV